MSKGLSEAMAVSDDMVERALEAYFQSRRDASAHENMRKALTAALSDQVAGWQPTETAPKDGTHILVCRGPYSEHWTFNQSPPAVVHYWTHPGANEDGFYLSNGGTDDDLPFEFTHWRELDVTPNTPSPLPRRYDHHRARRRF